MHNPTKREIREHENFLAQHLGDQNEIVRAQQFCNRAMRDAVKLVRSRGRVDLKHLFSSEADLRRMVETRDDESGFGVAGHITDDKTNRTWHVLVNVDKRVRRLVKVR